MGMLTTCCLCLRAGRLAFVGCSRWRRSILPQDPHPPTPAPRPRFPLSTPVVCYRLLGVSFFPRNEEAYTKVCFLQTLNAEPDRCDTLFSPKLFFPQRHAQLFPVIAKNVLIWIIYSNLLCIFARSYCIDAVSVCARSLSSQCRVASSRDCRLYVRGGWTEAACLVHSHTNRCESADDLQTIKLAQCAL